MGKLTPIPDINTLIDAQVVGVGNQTTAGTPVDFDAETSLAFEKSFLTSNALDREVANGTITPDEAASFQNECRFEGGLCVAIGAGGALIGAPILGGSAVKGLSHLAQMRIASKGHGAVTKTAIEIAREGGMHAGQLKQFKKQTPKQLQKTIRSFEKQILKHEAWIKDPASKVRNFNSLSKQHQDNIIHHWRQDIIRRQELRSIAQDVLKEL